MTNQAFKNPMRFLSLFGFLLCIVFGIWGWHAGIFASQAALNAYVGRFGAAGALVFIVFQAVQVVLPIIPGGLGCLAGVVLYGPWRGFLYNYIGICIGSMLVFALAKSYGRPLLYKLFPAHLIEKYDGWAKEKGRFTKWFAFLIFIPFAPDDYLCYLAGTTEMSWKTYTAIILLCKPAAIALYSMGLMFVFQQMLGLWG